MEQADIAAILPAPELLRALAPRFAAAAQRIYDDWQQDEDGQDAELGSGGICHLIADAMVPLICELAPDVRVGTRCLSDVQHVNVIVAARDGVYEVDIPHWVYERGSMFTWTKLPDIRFEADDVSFCKVEADPSAWWQHIDDCEPDDELASLLAAADDEPGCDEGERHRPMAA